MTDRSFDILFQIFNLCVTLALAAFSALCIVSPNKVAGYYRRQYYRSKLTQKLPFSNMILRPWSLTYLRVVGILGFLFVFVFLYATLHEFSK